MSEVFKSQDRPNVESVEFLSELRNKIATRVERDYPQVDNVRVVDNFRKGGSKFDIDSWFGDAFAHFVREYSLNESEYEILRKILFRD